MRFEWDAEKARRNLAKHRVSFEEAATAFSDPLSLTIPTTPMRRIASCCLAERAPGASSSCRTCIGTGASVLSVLESHSDESGGPMPAARKQKQVSDEMRLEYDFFGGIRGKYVARLARSTNVVVL